MMFNNDDDDDFAPTSGSKLASLFDLDQNKDGNQSLTYSAPKQPKQAVNPSISSSKQQNSIQSPNVEVIHACPIETCFKYENNKHVNQGRLGAAIVGNHQEKSYNLILYKTRQQQIAIATINNNFFFIIQANNYASFYDNSKMNWCLNFHDENLLTEFAKQICIAKANSCVKALESVITQNLVLGEGECLDTDDSVEIRYTGWILTDYKLGQIVDSNTSAEKALRFKIGRGKCIKGIDEALIGMRKNAKRFAIIPPSLGFATQRKTKHANLPNATLVYEIDVQKVKYNKDDVSLSTGSSTPSINELDNKDASVRVQSPSVGDDSSIRARGASLSEQLSQSPDRKKATIISRIVKMGQPMIPLQGAIVAQPTSESDNEDDTVTNITTVPQHVEMSSTVTEQPKPLPKPRPHSVVVTAPPQTQPLQETPSVYSVPQPVSIYQPTPYGLSNQLSYAQMPGNQFGMYPQPPYAAPPMPSSVMMNSNDAQLALSITENRAQLMEIRLQMSKMVDKLDQLQTSMDNSKSVMPHNIGSIDATSMLYNIQSIVQENSKLKAECAEKSAKIDNQNEKICELLQKNQTFMEQNNVFLEQKTNSIQLSSIQSQARFSALEDENLSISDKLNKTTIKLKAAELELDEAREKIKQLEERNKLLEKQQPEESVNKLKNLQEERDAIIQKLEAETALRVEKENEVIKLIEEKSTYLSETSVEKVKSLESQISCMKTEYETALATIDKSRDAAASSCGGVGVGVGVTVSAGGGQEMFSSVIVPEVKRIMNNVYRQLQTQFDANTKYTGTTVCKSIKETVLAVTLKLIERHDPPPTVALPEVNCNLKRFENIQDSETTEILLHKNQNSAMEKIEESELEVGDHSSTSKKVFDSEDKDVPDCHCGTGNNELRDEYWKPEPPPAPQGLDVGDDDDDEEEDDEDNEWLK